MRQPDRFEGLSAFFAVARRNSFRRAATELGVTAGAVSQTIRALEKRLGLPLFQRTTRSVALTEAGRALLARLGPATVAIEDALGAIETMRARPTGLLRLTVPRLVVPLFIEPVLPRFRALHPDVAVDISVDDAFVDLGSGTFDAGIRIGESISPDMVAVRLSRDLRWCVVGAPSYFAQHGHPTSLEDLANHQTIRKRRAGTNAIYRWELEDDGSSTIVDAPGSITVNDGRLALGLARAGLGLLYTADIYIAKELADGSLVETLSAHSTTSSGFFLYFSSGAQSQPKLRAFIDTLTAFAAATESAPRGRKRTRAAHDAAEG